MTEQILRDIENGLCITIDAENYIVYNSAGDVLHKLTDLQVQELVKLGKVKIIEQATSYIVETVSRETKKGLNLIIEKHYKIQIDDKRVKVSISCIYNTNLIESNYETEILGYHLYSVWGDFSDGYRTKFAYCKSKEEAEKLSKETSKKLEAIGYARSL